MSISKEERVRVAVRVRPFSQRELSKGCKRIVEMDGGVTTILTNPTDSADRKNFSFDHSYWSFDGFTEDADGKNVPDLSHPKGNQYCDQKQLFENLGRAMLTDAFEGYNTTLFSYGQTGSGKSYSVIGYGANEGIVPQFCRQIFRTLDERDTTEDKLAGNPVQFEVHLSMMEIYNETVHDLLNSSRNDKGLKVREHPKKGFFADGLSNHLVTSYSEIERLIEQGTLSRTVVATNMNATSSRSHTIVTISLVQKKARHSGEVTTSAVVSIVDLAGSERISKVGNTSGERFREGVAINQSLQCLGHCIRALAESSSTATSNNIHSNGQKGHRIPYRDSVLTKLLMNALGGNSKTIMIASISPADICYDETLSTLRYADRAKRIRTRATVNENLTEKLLRELKVENQRLKANFTRGNIDPQWLKATFNSRPTNPQALKEARKKWEEELRSQMIENEREMKRIRIASRQEQEPVDQTVTQLPSADIQQTQDQVGPYLQNVNMDPLLNGRWLHYLKQGITIVGKAPSELMGIEIIGPGMQAHHATIEVHEDQVTLQPITENSRVLVNGASIDSHIETVLQPNDRLVFGATQFWLFRHPALEMKAGVSDSPMFNYDFFIHEMAAKSGLNILSSFPDGNDLLQEELVSIIPSVEEANEISAEMNKRVKFEVTLVAPPSVTSTDKMVSNQVYIKMKNLDHGTEYLWSKDKFSTRFDFMKELYRQYQLRNYGEEGEAGDFYVLDDCDPFLESPDAVVIIGVAKIVLQSLVYLIEIQEHIPITDLRGIQVGSMEVALTPCVDIEGNQLKPQTLVNEPDQLIGRNLFFQFQILGCRKLPVKFKDIHCKYRFYGDKSDNRTEMHSYSPNLQFNYARFLRCEPVTKEFIEYLNYGTIEIEVLGRHLMDSHLFHHSYSLPLNSRKYQRVQRGLSGTAMNGELFDGTDGKKQELLAELQLVKQKHVRVQQRLDFIRQMTNRYILVGQESIPTALLDEILNVNNPEQARHIVQQLQSEEDSEWVDWNDPHRERNQRSSVCSLS